MLLLAVTESISQYKWLHFRSNGPKLLTDLQNFDAASRGPWGALRMPFIVGVKQVLRSGNLYILLIFAFL